jgi:hypothetical protein
VPCYDIFRSNLPTKFAMPTPEEKLKLTEEEIIAMRAIDSAVALGQSTAHIANISPRLFEHGVVEKGESGGFVLSGKGRKLLRASNMQG